MSTAEQKITDSAIVSTVRSSTSYQNDLNAKASKTDVSDLTTRVNSVEQSITATALTTTISSALSGSDSISTTKFTMNKDGLTIKNGGIKIQNNAGATVLTADTDGNLLVQNSLTVGGNNNGNIQLKNASNVNIFSANKNGIFLTDGVMKITSGNVVWDGIHYPEGDKKEMIVFANGINMYETQYMGSQEYIYQGYHYVDKLILIEDNRCNALQTYYETNITARRITTPSMSLGESNKGSSGYTALPNGLILQWGNNAGLQSGWGNYFPISFPNACLAVIPICTTHQIAVRVTSKSRDSFACNFGSTTGVGINFIAIGY
jgi:hypothetical protein